MVRGAGGLVFSTDGAFDPAGVEIVVVPPPGGRLSRARRSARGASTCAASWSPS